MSAAGRPRRVCIHPGEVLSAAFLHARGLSAGDLAAALGVPTRRIVELVDGSRDVNGALAATLGGHFGVGEQFWLDLQSAYDGCRADGPTRGAVERVEIDATTLPVPADLGRHWARVRGAVVGVLARHVPELAEKATEIALLAARNYLDRKLAQLSHERARRQFADDGRPPPGRNRSVRGSRKPREIAD